MSVILIRCPACNDLSVDPREEAAACAACGYTDTCPRCGIDIDAQDYDPDYPGACSQPCWADMEDETQALGRVGL